MTDEDARLDAGDPARMVECAKTFGRRDASAGIDRRGEVLFLRDDNRAAYLAAYDSWKPAPGPPPTLPPGRGWQKRG